MEFFVETAISAEVQAICLKLCEKSVFLQNFQTKEWVKTSLFYSAIIENISLWQTYKNNVVITLCSKPQKNC